MKKYITKLRGVCIAVAFFASVIGASGQGTDTITALDIGTTPAGTIITSQAFADLEDDNGNPLARVFSNEVETLVLAVAGVEVVPDTASVSAQINTEAVQSFTIINLGNDTDTFTFSIATDAVGWNERIVADTNGNGVLDVDEVTPTITTSGELAPGETLDLHLVVDVPSGAVDELFTVTATSDFDTAVSESGAYTFSVQSAVLKVTKAIVETDSYQPGDEVIYRLEIAAEGDSVTLNQIFVVDDIPPGTTYVANSLRIGPSTGTYASATPVTDADGDDLADFDVTNPGAATFGAVDGLQPGNTVDAYYFKVTINPEVLSGQTISNTSTGQYVVNGDPLPDVNSNSVSFQVDAKADLLLEEDQAQFAAPGEEISYELTVTNNGNTSDTINMATLSSIGLTWTWYYAPAGSLGFSGQAADTLGLPLEDTNSDGIVDTGPIDAFTSINVIVVTTLPAGVDDGLADATVAVAGSILDSTVTSAVTLTTTIEAPVINVVKSVSPTGSQVPNTVLTYTVVTTNSGRGVARDLIVTDPIPEFTDYVPGTIRTAIAPGELTPRTDADDNDGGTFDGSLKAVQADSIDLGPGGSSTLEFQVKIQ